MGRRDVIWVTLESLRRDRTSFGESGRDATPNLQSLASDAVSFDQCYSHDIWTRASVASILTGHASSAHRTWSNSVRLPDEIQTIPEAFGEVGYENVGVSPIAQVSEQTGLARGFDEFHYLTKSSLLGDVGPFGLAKWLANLREHSGGYTLDSDLHCTGYLLNHVARSHIRDAATGADSLFLYVHHVDSHHAYVPPVNWRDRFEEDLPCSPGQAVETALDVSANLHEYVARGLPLSADEWEALRIMYDTAVAYVDHLAGELVSTARKLLDDPIIVVTGDHGELFGEEGLLAHMLSTHSAVSNVPLVVEGLDGLQGDGLIQHADVVKMICDDVGVPHPVPAGRDVREEPREFAFTQRSADRARTKLETIETLDPDFDSGSYPAADVTTVHTGEWHYRTSATASSLHPAADESRDVSDERGEVVSRLDDAV